MKLTKTTYWIATGLLSILLIASSGMYVLNNEIIQESYFNLGYPTYLIYPLAILKISAVVFLLIQKKSKIKEWAYAGLFFEFVLAFFAHLMVQDGEQFGAALALVLLITSYYTYQRINNLTLQSQ